MYSLNEFNALKEQGYNHIPLFLELHADLDTPLSVYLKLANQPYTYLLESVEGGERFGRYSFIGLASNTRISLQDKQVTLYTPEGISTQETEDPLDFLDQYQTKFKAPAIADLPRFIGGLVGYFSYDTIHYIEKKLAHTTQANTQGTPDALWMLSEELIVFDNLKGKLYLIVYANPNTENAYAQATQRLQTLKQDLRAPLHYKPSQATSVTSSQSEWGEVGFKQAVQRAKDYILEGDIMQVVLAQRMHMPYEADPVDFYRALRSLNPSPYMYLYHFDDFHVIGSSPEILVRHESNTVTVRPIAGTRKRGKTTAEDLALEQDLLNDPKEIAEHIMLMDLGRNDVGRIAKTGSVHVTAQMNVERYSHVMHIVSSVEGELKEGVSNMDVLRATFPAGTLSGAPKVRAMQIIEELEPSKRGVYGGAVGYLGFNGDMDLAIAIRTAVIKDKTLYVQAGAGVVADSTLEGEWQETLNKARAVIDAAKMALQGLDV